MDKDLFIRNDEEWLWKHYIHHHCTLKWLKWEIDKEGVGVLVYFENQCEIYIYFTLVDKKHRGNGILREMLHNLENTYPSKNIKLQFYMLYKPALNATSAPLEACFNRIKKYEKYGFRKVSMVGECFTMMKFSRAITH